MTAPGPIELWGGVECTVNRVGHRFFDQIARSGHDARPDDLERFAALGLRTLRQPVLWERIAPDGLERADWRSTDAAMERLRALGIRTVVGLVHHGSGPPTTSLIDPEFPLKLAKFAAAVAERYPWVIDYTPVNEPLTTARFSGLYGLWYPHGTDGPTFVRALVNQCRATVQVMAAIRARTPAARLILTEDYGRTLATPRLADQARHENLRRLLSMDLLTGRVDRHHPLWGYLEANGCGDLADLADGPPPDLLGLNYYITSDRWLDERLETYPFSSHGGNDRFRYADVEAVRAVPDGVTGHEAALCEIWNRYRIPVALTEVHLAGPREQQLRWLVEAWEAAERARNAGADVRAVTVWSLLGAFDWDRLVTSDAGTYEPGPFDVSGGSPRPTALARLVASLASGQTFDHPVARDGGWWRHPRRIIWGPAPAAAPAPTRRLGSRPPILVLGRGTLGRAFARICELRGLSHRLLGRRELDIGDRAAARGAILDIRPWAVVNAAGYVRVDDAEDDAERCHRDNALAPAELATVCADAGLPLVSFSSDLVFDGASDRPYLESDRVDPLNVYGASKARAEAELAARHPEALVVRTSAFFGPWDEANFVSAALASLAARRPFVAMSDVTVSPTYVPDMVHACLDLLIDGEKGVWHLANDGELSWLELARAVAVRAGLDVRLVQPRTLLEMRLRAPRPRYSALGSSRGRLLPSIDVALGRFLRDRSTVAPARAGAA